MTEYDADVVILGGGPTGLMLAIELRLGGVSPLVLERLPEISQTPKGNGLIGQIVPLLDFRGLLEPLRSEATFAGPVPGFSFGPVFLDLGRLSGSPLDILAIPQRKLELQLSKRLHDLGGAITRGHEVTGIRQDDSPVTLEVRGPDGGEYQLRTRYLAGCDGAHSLARKQAGIGFPGFTSGEVSRMGRVRLPLDLIDPVTGAVEVPGFGTLEPMRMVLTATGFYSIGPLAWLDADAPPGAYIISTREDEAASQHEDDDKADYGPDGEGDAGTAATGVASGLTLAELRASVRRVLGADLPMSEPQWLAKIVGNSRQADRYQQGRILLAGDAAHVFGLGGSLNTGLMDAMNLGWKLAAEVGGRAPAGLLASYHSERHAAGCRALLQSRSQRALTASGEAAAALRALFGELARYPEVTRHLGELMQGSDVRYDMAGTAATAAAAPAGRVAPGDLTGGAGPALHPMQGRVAPDLQLTSPAGRSMRLAELMRAARPVLLDYTSDGRVAAAAAAWSGDVPALTVRPRAGRPPADGLLIRPDGYVAWAAGPDAADPAAGLAEALSTWCGPPRTDR